MTGYSTTILESSKQLTVRERIMLKDTSNAISLDEATQENSGTPLVIKVAGYAILAVHNEHSDSKDYTKYVIFDENNTKFVTGSESFWTAFKEIYDEMIDAGEETFDIGVYRLESKNYKGKSFITCSIM